MKRTPRDEFLRTVRLAGIAAFDRIAEHTDKLAADLRTHALEAIQVALSPPVEPPPVPARVTTRAPRQLAAPKVGGGRGGVMHCSKCGAEGFNARGCGLTHDANGAIGAPKELEDPPDEETDEEPSTRARAIAAAKTRKRAKGSSNVSSGARAILERTRKARGDLDDSTG